MKKYPVFFPFPVNNQFLNLNRLRLKPEADLWANARINVEYEIDALYSEKNLLFDLSSVSTSRQLFNLKWDLINEGNYKVSHYFDRLYFRQDFNWGNISIGRQRIAWGSGRIWNPIDLFNPVNPANFAKIEKDGADVAALTYFFGNFTDLDVVYNPQKKIANSNAGFRFRTNLEQYDLAVVGGYFDKRIVAGWDFAGSLLNAGIRGEGIVSMNKENISDNYTRFTLGTDYQITPELYALAEYQYNGEGKANKANYELLRLVNGEILNLSRNYLALSANYVFSFITSASLLVNQNLNDGSGFVAVSGLYSITSNLSLTVGAQITYGNDFSEYWYFPHSVYSQVEYYF
ncbi:MAG: hypothetical protein WCE54_23300 [Ignavibacteriaceae bacterium]